ncbi:MAG: PHP domain-containing protein, partial [Gammaproteobacteria bacterium]
MTAASGFVHLRVHSEYSVADGLFKIKDLAVRAAALGMPAVALTDQANLFAAVKFFQACLEQGIKPILGVDLQVIDPEGEVTWSTVLAQNETGYRNLLALVSAAYVGAADRGHIPRDLLFTRAEGLIALSGGRSGALGRALLKGDTAAATARASAWSSAFPGRFYIELTR